MRLRMPLMLAAGLLVAAPHLAQADDVPVEQQIVDVMNKLFGSHPGFRANHAKGVVVHGTFTAAPEASSLTKAAQFAAGTTTPIVGRFSDATGVPTIPDGDANANPHGFAIKFHLKDGSDTDIVCNSLKTFPVATGEEFRDLLTAASQSGPDAAKPTKLETFIAAHPSVPKALSALATPASFATEQYNGVDAFVFTNQSGAKAAFRYRIVPTTGIQHLTPVAAKSEAPDFLVTEIASRLKKGPVSFQLLAQVASQGDPTRDPTVAWPDDRKLVPLGTITLTSVDPDSDKAQKALLFLPGQLTDGIEQSDDPLIDTRNGAYAVSFSRRNPQ